MNSMTMPTHDHALTTEELTEWQDSLRYIFHEYGEEGVKLILEQLNNQANGMGIGTVGEQINTPYINTITPDQQPDYPGNRQLEQRLENIIRWNAAAMVMKAQDSGSGVGGHIATYASAATMLEVGFNHFFRNKSDQYGGDLLMVQAHAAPGLYARAFLEGRLSEAQLGNYRRQLQPAGGLSSYPHPRLMPEFWQAPSASMGLSTPTAIYQARFAKYLEQRGLKPKNGGKVWCFVGDGESDEPEVLGTINIAVREGLDNLVLVINCNLQRLDGPVRGNGKIIQELERSFRGSGWNVIKTIWGSGWDKLLADDKSGALKRRMEQAVDGDYQYYSASTGDIQREHWVESSSELSSLMTSLSDDELKQIKRGGHDPEKIYAAFDKASKSEGKPTVILVKTVKGDGLGESSQGKNTVHQKKTLTDDERLALAKNLGISLPEDAVKRADFYQPDSDSEEIKYLHAQRQKLGGYLPSRKVESTPIQAPELASFKEPLNGSGERSISTTSAMVRILASLIKHPDTGKYVVPIVPDEARTFGMEGLFKAAGIYSAVGQQYTPVDAATLTPYREATDGQILQEGICETGAMASFLAAGTAYAVHGVPTIPFYIYYSMFGFQRVGDMIWSCADMLCRGFLLGGTAGRTTLNGEGLQHQDGHTHLMASTVPNLKSYDPAFAYELAVIVQDGIQRMYVEEENIFYYITLYNENYPMPALPEQAGITEAIIKGGYCFQRSALTGSQPQAQLLSSGAIMQQTLKAAEVLEEIGIAANIWSITSFTELQREALAADRYNQLHPLENPKASYISELFHNESGAFVAVTDYMKSLPLSIAPWMPANYTALGTDGFGLSESRDDLREHFEINPDYIVAATLNALYRAGDIDKALLKKGLAAVSINPDKADPALT